MCLEILQLSPLCMLTEQIKYTVGNYLGLFAIEVTVGNIYQYIHNIVEKVEAKLNFIYVALL